MTLADNILTRHLRRLCLAGMGSELVPAFLRIRLLNALGASLDPSACIWPGCRMRSTRLEMGRESFINVGFFFDGTARLKIGSHVRIGQFFSAVTGTHEIGPAEQRCTIEAVLGDVVIEDGCWIGVNVTVLPGVTIAKGCVIGAGSLVTASTEPNGVYVGSPARRIRDLPLGKPERRNGRTAERAPSPFPSVQRAGATAE
ncbi:acyltransferase [Acetobacter sp.]|jgi:maltose O-acetyltransferase|uniref:acyltransferase n=1 Tax=Acetobacter sp. TaxID=440 RepID=UPI0025C6BD02|nr:acyltransferase [Acetobacter sp.]MCH4091336.1 acyltransferase [Acetobacter sp.]MCI1299314.1 acyltransferase [Acetobacter sp.]MCI1316682.1 acyltransferase [Acetobacter sp.]